MQKKLIALAVAALASGAAFAQTNVTLYGTVDIGFAHRGNSDIKGEKSQFAINSGQAAASKLGFTGVEDLGNGNKALFVLEAGFQGDDGTHGKGGSKLFNEQAFLGLTGGWGTSIAGRLVAPRYGFLSALDPFSDGTVGRFGNVYEDITPLGVAVANVDRVDNAIAYVSPSFGGFNVTAAYATNGVAPENAGNDHDARVYTLLPRYTNGPLDIGLVWQQVSFKNGATVPTGLLGGVDFDKLKLKQWTLGASYDFGAVKLSAAYDDFKTSGLGGTLGKEQRLKSWLIGLSVPFGKSAIQFSYNQSKAKTSQLGLDVDAGLAEGKARQIALGYTYSLSKRTNVYAAYARIKNDNDRGITLNDATNCYAGAGYRRGLNLGLKHTF